MDKTEFAKLRHFIGRTQKQLAALLGVSLQAVHSYEQGWRTIPVGAERQLLFLAAAKIGSLQHGKPCWQSQDCPPEQKDNCPAWEFQLGRLCWFVNGTRCHGELQTDWRKKMAICRECEVMADLWEAAGQRGATEKTEPEG